MELDVSENGRSANRGIGGVQSIATRAALLVCLGWGPFCRAAVPETGHHERMVEWTIESRKKYLDPFNDVEVDVVFRKQNQTWRVPMFWRGAQRWSVRFAPPSAGTYTYHLESTDKNNVDLNGHEGRVTISPYLGSNPFLKHGYLRVSTNGRYFEHQDGTPFFWLGDTWWAGLSTRLSWDGFKALTADRKRKGFTVVQMVAGLVPTEEICPEDPGCKNEGGAVWEPHYRSINPRYFDYADRRVEFLVNAGIAPAIVGAWSAGDQSSALDDMGVAKLEKHWRYIIARFGAYPVFWIVGGEVFDPPDNVVRATRESRELRNLGAWTELARYVRATDPYHHPVTAHEISPDDPPLQHESLLDFRLFQPGHFEWSSIAVEIAQLNLHYARTQVRKPLVVGEIGYEKLGGTHLDDFQRAAFWLAMLNGAAGYTYGAAGTWESYAADQPPQRFKLSLLTWREGMNLPGSYQLGIAAGLLEQYKWWEFAPHPEWVSPHGTTLLESRAGIDDFHIDIAGEWGGWWGNAHPSESEWTRRAGNFRLPYSAGIPGQVRVVYIDRSAVMPLTIRGLEAGVGYHAYYWEPSLGVRVDLGLVRRSAVGEPIFEANNAQLLASERAGLITSDFDAASNQTICLAKGIEARDVIVSGEIHAESDASLVIRYHDIRNYLTANYSAADKAIYVVEHKDGITGAQLGRTVASDLDGSFRLITELRGRFAVVSVVKGSRAVTGSIVEVADVSSGGVGATCRGEPLSESFGDLEILRSPKLDPTRPLQRKLYDAAGVYRGNLQGGGLPRVPEVPDWNRYGSEQRLLLDAYQPDGPPFPGDWVLVMETPEARAQK